MRITDNEYRYAREKAFETVKLLNRGQIRFEYQNNFLSKRTIKETVKNLSKVPTESLVAELKRRPEVSIHKSPYIQHGETKLTIKKIYYDTMGRFIVRKTDYNYKEIDDVNENQNLVRYETNKRVESHNELEMIERSEGLSTMQQLIAILVEKLGGEVEVEDKELECNKPLEMYEDSSNYKKIFRVKES